MPRQLSDKGANHSGWASAVVVILTLLVVLAMVGLTLTALLRERKHSLQGAVHRASAQAQLLGEHAAGLLYNVDLTLLATKHLLEVATEVSSDAAAETTSFPPEVADFIRAQQIFLPQVSGFAYFSATGELLHSSSDIWADSPPPSLAAHRDSWLELFVGTIADKEGEVEIFISRRIERADRSFAGVLAVAVTPAFFSRRYENYLGNEVTATLLFDRSGTVLAGWSADGATAGKNAGLTLDDLPTFADLAEALPLAGGLQSRDEAEQFLATFQLADFPFHIAVASSKKLVLAGWYAESRKNLAVLAISALLAGVATLIAGAHRRKRRAAEAALHRHKLRLEQTVVQRTRDISRINRQLVEKNEALGQALAEIKTLSAFLPICSYCKKIRDDNGSWNQMEQYIGSQTGTEFSHGICPDCAKVHFPDIEL